MAYDKSINWLRNYALKTFPQNERLINHIADSGVNGAYEQLQGLLWLLKKGHTV
jgi:hypothetical protein